MSDNESYCPECGSGDSEGQLGHATGCSLKDKWPKTSTIDGHRILYYVGKQRPALTDEQVREIAERHSVSVWESKIIGNHDVRRAIEAAIREAIGRGERG